MQRDLINWVVVLSHMPNFSKGQETTVCSVIVGQLSSLFLKNFVRKSHIVVGLQNIIASSHDSLAASMLGFHYI